MKLRGTTGMTWPLITWAHGKCRTFYRNFHQDYKLDWTSYMNKLIPFLSFLYVTWFIITRFLYLYMSCPYVTWSRNLLNLHSATSKKTITNKLGGNTCKNETAAYLHMTRPNHAKVIKATAPKAVLMKGTNLNRPHDF